MAEAELAWMRRKLVLLMPVHVEGPGSLEGAGWKTVVAEGEWQQRLSEELVIAVKSAQ